MIRKKYIYILEWKKKHSDTKEKCYFFPSASPLLPAASGRHWRLISRRTRENTADAQGARMAISYLLAGGGNPRRELEKRRQI